MTPFVETFYNRQLLPPWVSEGCTNYGFVVRVAEGNVRGYLDTFLNGEYPERAPYYYAPLTGPQFGVLSVAFHPKVSSCFPGRPPGWDTVSHTEVYWTFPVRRWKITPDNLLVEPKVVWVQPFSMDSSPTLVFGSREIWGGDMVVAAIEHEHEPLPGRRARPLHVDVAFDGFRKFAPESKSERLGCFHVVIDEDASIEMADALAANQDMAQLAAILGSSGVFAGRAAPSAESDAVKGSELNNLKQFRSADNMEMATYRAIVASRTWHTEVDNLAFYAAGKARVDVFWSASMAEILVSLFDIDGRSIRIDAQAEHGGLSGPDAKGIDWNLPRASLPVEIAYSFTSNARFEVVETLHTYGG